MPKKKESKFKDVLLFSEVQGDKLFKENFLLTYQLFLV